ncbi:uncharacterized protein BKA78DRAFT_299176 [Phyllosticta capitalensis]|uniref:uncharacterized protein n=1 Tax=Phyllosticta capitalensis TaxID=121624 RepID=UPI0031310F65
MATRLEQWTTDGALEHEFVEVPGDHPGGSSISAESDDKDFVSSRASAATDDIKNPGNFVADEDPSQVLAQFEETSKLYRITLFTLLLPTPCTSNSSSYHNGHQSTLLHSDAKSLNCQSEEFRAYLLRNNAARQEPERQEQSTWLRRKWLNKWNALRDKSSDARSTTPYTHGGRSPHNDQVNSAASSRTPCAYSSTLPQDTDPATGDTSTQALCYASLETPCAQATDGRESNFLVLPPEPVRGQEERKFLVAQLQKDMNALQKLALRLMDENSKAKKREAELLKQLEEVREAPYA